MGERVSLLGGAHSHPLSDLPAASRQMACSAGTLTVSLLRARSRVAPKQQRVLAIDTDTAFLTAVRRMVESRSCVVDCARTAAQAQAYIARHHYNLVLADLALPEMDAATLCERLAEAVVKGTRILFLAAEPPSAETRAYLEKNHLSYLDKPVHLRRFLDKLDDLLLGSYEETEEVQGIEETKEE